jgi:hypothetical protein
LRRVFPQTTTRRSGGISIYHGWKGASRQSSDVRSLDALTNKLQMMVSSVTSGYEECCDSNGWVRIVGFGSLLAESSARRSFPSLRGLTLVNLPGCARVFGHAAPVFFERGIATPGAPYEAGSLCCEPWREKGKLEPAVLGAREQFDQAPADAARAFADGRFMTAVAFFIPVDAMEEFRRREPEFTYVPVQPWSVATNKPDGVPALACGRGSDEMLRERLQNSDAAWHNMVGRHGIATLWHDQTILPCRPYLRLCVLAAEQLGISNNFLKSTFLADRATTVGEYIAAHPEIMTTLPPLHVRHFYTP